jgi:hypothetical protein
VKKFIAITCQFEATHRWDNCNIAEVLYLKNEHRHLFHVTVKFKVTSNDRQIEFIQQKHTIEDFIRLSWERKLLGTISCEMMADILFTEFKADYVSVFEDGENGAEIYRTKKDK